MEKKVREEKMILGIIGAIVAALVCSLVWILLDQVGFIASFAAIIIFLGSIKGYEIVGGKLSRKGLVICVIITLLTVLVADYVSLGITVYQSFSGEYDITLIDSILVARAFLEDAEVLMPFLGGLAMGYVFVAIGCYKTVKNLWAALGEMPSEMVTVRVNGAIPEEAFDSED